MSDGRTPPAETPRARVSLEPSDAILTVPNVLTFLRLALIPLFLWLALGIEHMGWAVVAGTLGFATDLIDGRVARRYGQVTKLGILLDPLSDRLSLASAGAVIIVHSLAPWWAIALVLVRDGALLLAAPLVKARAGEIPPVSALGKKASFAVSLAFGLFVVSAIPGVTRPNDAVRVVAWVVFGLGIPLYYIAAIGYARAALAPRRSDGSGG